MATPLGLRDRAMLELLYASGLRVSELVTLKTVQLGLAEGALRVTGKGGKERLVPFGEEAHGSITRYLAHARAAILAGQASDALFVTARGGAMTRQMFWKLIKRHALAAGIAAPLSPHTCGTPLRPTCSTTAPTCARCRCCSATPTSRRRRSIPTWRASGYARCTPSITRAAEVGEGTAAVRRHGQEKTRATCAARVDGQSQPGGLLRTRRSRRWQSPWPWYRWSAHRRRLTGRPSSHRTRRTRRCS